MQAIFEINSNRKAPKYLQIVHSVTKSIKQGKLKTGDRLLSINELSNEFLLARDTVQKAYNILQEDGILLPVKGKGFYIRRTDSAAHYLIGDYAALYCDFVNDIIKALKQGVDLLRKYDKIILVYPKVPHHPEEIVTAVYKFCMQNNFKHSLLNEININAEISERNAYIVIEETDLVALLKNCHSRGFRPGVQVGIISYNDTPLKEILADGITVISIDHGVMCAPAKRIPDNKKDKIRNPFSLIIRKSL